MIAIYLSLLGVIETYTKDIKDNINVLYDNLHSETENIVSDITGTIKYICIKKIALACVGKLMLFFCFLKINNKYFLIFNSSRSPPFSFVSKK